MARVIVRNRDKVNKDDPYLDAQCMKKGMVVDILPDGKSLGTKGDKYDGWTVVEFPGVAVDDLRYLMLPQVGDPRVNRMLQRRTVKIDIDAYAANARPLTVLDVQTFSVAVAQLDDPNVL